MKTHNRRLSMLLALVLLTPISVLAGGWTSSGGELYKDRYNPWFLTSPQVVPYCIVIGPEFGVDEGRLGQLIQEAFGYWKKEWAGIDDTLARYITVAQNEYLQVPCEENPIIRFQFGHLDESQKAKIDTGDTIALAVRTEYDRQSLVGRGFIYVAPSSGPLKPNGIHSKAWAVAENLALLPVLIHETGHVFGLPDNDISLDSGEVNYMSRDVPKTYANPFTVNALMDAEQQGWIGLWKKVMLASSYFAPNCPTESSEFSWIHLNDETDPKYREQLARFFGADLSDVGDIMLRYEQEELKVYSVKYTSDAHPDIKELLGKMSLACTLDEDDKLYEPTLWLSADQAVVPKSVVPMVASTPLKTVYSRRRLHGSYISVDGQTQRPLFGELQGAIKLGTVLDNEVILDLSEEPEVY